MKKHLATMFALLSAVGIILPAFGEGFDVISSDAAAALGGATGGDIVRQIDNGDGTVDLIHIFTSVGSSGSLTIPSDHKIKAASLRALIVGGGGGGGFDCGAGGGAGGLVYKENLNAVVGSAAITVGNGGAGGSGSSSSETRRGSFGENSTLTIGSTTYTALGGGGGGGWSDPNGLAGSAGGSGGGSGGTAGAGVATQPSSESGGFGNVGGLGVRSNRGGGGGGAGGAGQAAANDKGGDGGAGLPYDISGTTEIYAAGGGAARLDSSYGVSAEAGVGGSDGVGGNGQTSTEAPTSGRTNSGSGGGGGKNGSVGAAGSAGVVIIRYTVTVPVPANVKEFVDRGLITFSGAASSYKNGELILKYTNVTTPGKLTIDPSLKVQAEILVVGGGGAGGTVMTGVKQGAGGGGAGGVILWEDEEKITLPSEEYTITVGAGGAAAEDNSDNFPGENGQPSSLVGQLPNNGYVALGGGGGGAASNGADGGSGGGATKGNNPGKGDPEQGNDGGTKGTSTITGGAGGGGAGSAGGKCATPGGVGGSSIETDISGSPTAYAGGGGGGKTGNSGAGGAGGCSDGGTGGSAAADGVAGAANTGSGGGGSGKGTKAGSGADGVVIVRLVNVLETMVDAPESVALTWTGFEQTALDTSSIAYAVVSGETAATKPGNYSYVVKPGEDLTWRDNGGTEPRTITWSIVPVEVVKPTLTTANFVYDGTLKNPGATAQAGYTLSGDLTATNAASYAITATLNNLADEIRYVWKGETEAAAKTAPLTLAWTIAPVEVTKPTVATDLVYTGEEQAVLTLGEHMSLHEGKISSTAARDYSFTIKLDNAEGLLNYVWAGEGHDNLWTVDWSIAKAPNAITKLTIVGWKEGATKHAPVAEATWGTPVIRYAASETAAEEDWSPTPPETAGTWWVRATVAEAPNWLGADKKISFAIWDNPMNVFTDHVDITPSGYTGGEALVNFPLPIRVSENKPAGFSYARAGADGTELAFICGDDILDYDIECWDPNGESVIWVKVPSLTATTMIEMWWNLQDGQTTAGPNAAAVWDDYIGVWHFGETIDATVAGTTASKDATGHGYDAEPANYNATASLINKMVSVPGVVGQARQTCDAINLRGPRFEIKNSADLTFGGQLTLSGWYDMNQHNGPGSLVIAARKAAQHNTDGWYFQHASSTSVSIYGQGAGRGNAQTTIKTVNPDTVGWVYFSMAYDATKLTAFLANDGTQGQSTGTIEVAGDNGMPISFGAYAGNQDQQSFVGYFDEFRLSRVPRSVTWAQAEYQSMRDPTYVSFGLVDRGGELVNDWVRVPSITPTNWDIDDHEPFAIDPGELRVGDVTYVIYDVTDRTNTFTDPSNISTAGLYVAEFTMAEPTTGYAPIRHTIELRAVKHQPYSNIGGTNGDSGRVLLMNRDVNKACPIDRQGVKDKSNTQVTYWEFMDSTPPGSTAFHLENGTNSVLWKKDGLRLWHLQGCRHGNTFPARDSDELVEGQCYLPWKSSTAYRYNSRSLTVSVRSHAGRIVMQNIAGPSVTSSCFTNGVGTIYFDAVNGWRSDKTDETSAYRLAVEYAEATDEGKVPTDANCDAGDVWYAHLTEAQWKPVPQVILFKRDTADGTGDFEKQVVDTNVFALAVSNDRTVGNFYRVVVPMNTMKPMRFRIRRETCIPRTQVTEDEGGLIVLDNIIVSFPPMSAELAPTGFYDPTKHAKQVLGQEFVTTVPFPTAGASDVYGRAQVVAHVNDGQKDVKPETFISEATLHYRWRYLDQQIDAWKETYLDPQHGLKSIQPLDLPAREGDVEFWYEAKLSAPFYGYVDYSGTGLGVPYSEEIETVVNHFNAKALPSRGTDWFFRLRPAACALESITMQVRSAESNALEAVRFEVAEEGIWRGYLKTTNAIPAGLSVRFDAVEPTGADADATLVTNCWRVTRGIREFPASLTLTEATTNDWTALTVDGKTGYLKFQIDERTRSLAVAHADYQDFNRWNDAHRDAHFVGNSTEDDKKSGVSSKMRDYQQDFATWADTPETNDKVWCEPFTDGTGDFSRWNPFVYFSSRDTPNGWIVGPGMFVNQQYKVNGASGAYQMEGQGKGFLEYPGGKAPADPRGIDAISFKARLAQTVEFRDIAYRDADGKLSMTNYTFATQFAMCDHVKDLDTKFDFDGAGQVSLVACYRPMIGCYEFRVTRVNQSNAEIALYKWSSANGNLKATLLASETRNVGEDMFREWRENTNLGTPARYPLAYITAERVMEGANATMKIQAGLSTGHSKAGTQVNQSDQAVGFRTLTYWDDQPGKLTCGTYGLAAANCNAVFVSPRKWSQATPWLGNTDKGSSVSDAAVRFPADDPELEQKPIENGEWVLEDGRMAELDTPDQTEAERWGLQAYAVAQKLLVQRKAAGTGLWETVKELDVSGFLFGNAVQTVTLRRVDNATYRLVHGGTLEDSRNDIVVDDVKLTQWRGAEFGDWDAEYDYDDGYGYRTNFVFTSGWVTNHAVQLSARRTKPGTPCSIRSPLMDGNGGRGLGLGMISFNYENATANVELLVQIATNNVAGTIRNETFAGADSDLWTTVTNISFAAATDRAAGSRNVYLGLHGVKGLMRLVMDPKVVDAVQDETDVNNFGSIDITSVFCRDEPELDLASWWGWNLRTVNDDGLQPVWDDGSRMILSDGDATNDKGGRGLSLALNYSTTAGTKADESDLFKQHMPFVQTPTFADALVGEVTFKARCFGADSGNDVQRAEVRLYGARSGDPNIPDTEWEELAHFVVSNAYYETYHFRSPSSHYKAFRLGVSGVEGVEASVRGEKPTEGTSPVRVLIEEVVVSEAVYPLVGFRYAYPVRTNLDGNEKSPAVDELTNKPNCDEQPLLGENWTLQAEIEAKQLPDELDLDTPGREPRVFFHWYADRRPWGMANWRKTGATVAKTAELALAEGETMVFRGSFAKAPSAIVDEVSDVEYAVCQYTASVVYYDKTGDVHTNWLSKAEWQRPEWYDPVDYNTPDVTFTPFTILDSISPDRVWINEVNVFDGKTTDNTWPADNNQYIELAVPDSQPLTGWRLEYVDFSQVTNTLCIFGENGVVDRKNSNVTNDYTFLAVQSPMTERTGTWANEYRPDGKKVEIDATWANFDNGGGLLDQKKPIALRLVRPSRVVEQEIVLEGHNNYRDGRYADLFSVSNLIAKLERDAAGQGHYYPVGDEYDNDLVMGLEGRSLGVFRGIGATSNDWNNVMHQTPGWCNEGQLVPEDWAILPNGAMIVITARLEGGHIVQTFGDAVDTVDSVRVTTQKGGPGTNIVYTVDTWYELADVLANKVSVKDGATVAKDALTGRKTYTLTLGASCSNNLTVVASAKPWDDLVTKYGLDPNDKYTPAVMDWLERGVNWWGEGFERPGEISLSEYHTLGGAKIDDLSLRDMYWLDMDPTVGSNWWFVAGVSEAPKPIDKPMLMSRAMSLAVDPGIVGTNEWGEVTVAEPKNIQLKLRMYMTNLVDHATYAPYVIRCVEPGLTSYDYKTSGSGQWDSASFKMTGCLLKSATERTAFVPLRWFFFLPDSHKANRSASFADGTNEAVVDVWDPFDGGPGSPTSGWDKYRGNSVFYSWAIDERMVPTTVEALKPDSTY